MTVRSSDVGTVLCFAYGSNLCPARLASRVAIRGVLGIGRLPQHELRWHKRSKDGSTKCDAYFTGRNEDSVVGVVYEIPASEKLKLDRAEGLGYGYSEKTADIAMTSGSVRATLYVAIKDAIDATGLPYDWYRAHVACGAADHSLPLEYQRTILATPAMQDPDPSRAASENDSRRRDRHPQIVGPSRTNAG